MGGYGCTRVDNALRLVPRAHSKPRLRKEQWPTRASSRSYAAATSWLLLQLAAIVLPTFSAPHWVLKVLIGVFVLFFPIALIVAWAFESTSDGVRRTVPADSEEARQETTGRRLGRKIDFVIIVVLVAAVGVLAWRQFGTQSTRPASRVAVAATATTSTPVSAPAKGTAIPAKSIAVLPFENLSLSKQNAFFAAGMQDLILTKLADIGGLAVTSRTSTMQYGSHPENLQTIWEQLGVATILEGSVQRIGDQVLINVQLINAHSDHHIWAKSYTRTLKNVFGVEGEVAETIANTLNAKLTAPEKRQLATAPTTNAAAYNAYLRARALENRSGNISTAVLKGQVVAYREAVAHERQALALDPRNVSLIDGTTNTFIALHDFAPARALTNRALALSPSDPEAIVAKATIDEDEGRFAAANKVLAPLKAEVDTVRQIVNGKMLVHDYAGAVRVARKAVADPSCHASALAEMICYTWLGYAEHFAGQSAQARTALHRSVEAGRVDIVQASGRRNKALGYIVLDLDEAYLGHKTAALVAGHKAVAMFPPSKDAAVGPAYQEYLTIIEAWAGEREVAIKQLRHLLTVPNLVEPLTIPILRVDPRLDALHGDSRFQVLLKENPTHAPSATSSG